jgi:hypothetical protein
LSLSQGESEARAPSRLRGFRGDELEAIAHCSNVLIAGNRA